MHALQSLFRILVLSLLLAPLASPAADGEKRATLTLKLSFPDGAEISPEAVFWGRLWEYDPFLADASAKQVAEIELTSAKFKKGTDGVVSISAQLQSALKERRKYYVTAFVYPDAKKDERARRFFLDGFNKVFESGGDQTIEAVLKATR